MAKRGRPPKIPTTQPPWYKKLWVVILGILGFISLILGIVTQLPQGLSITKGWLKSAISETTDSLSICPFPKKFQKDTLYVLVARFEDNISTIESECYGSSLRDRIDNISHQRRIPIRVCYNEKIAINSIEEAKRVQKEYNADVVFYGTIRNIEKSCMAGDVCFKNQLSDTLIRLAGGEVKVEDTKYEKGLSPERIEMGDFHVREKRFDTWLFTYFNAKIGKFNPDLYAIDESLPINELAIEYFTKGRFFDGLCKYTQAINSYNKSILLNPKNEIAIYCKGVSNFRLGKYSDAIKDLDKAIKLDPDFSPSYYYMDIVYQLLALKAIKEHNLEKAEGYLSKGRMYYKKRRKINI